MDIQLIQGQFNARDAIDIVTHMIHIKVKYHENQIINMSNEEDVKFQEAKIKRLQKELFEFRNSVDEKNGTVKLNAVIQIDI